MTFPAPIFAAQSADISLQKSCASPGGFIASDKYICRLLQFHFLTAGCADGFNRHSAASDNFYRTETGIQKLDQLIISPLCQLAFQQHTVCPDIRHLYGKLIGDTENLSLIDLRTFLNLCKHQLFHMDRGLCQIHYLDDLHHPV